jgi:vanillate/3-O-methylgallate O-demethylase
MRQNSIAQQIQVDGNAFEMLYNGAGSPFSFPVQAEFSNWRDEQEAWRRTAIFQNMSHHMCNAFFEGPDVYRLLSDLGINSFAGFGPMQAKQYVVCNSDGHYIGDAVLTCAEENKVCIVGKPNVPHWVQFHLETGQYDARLVNMDMPSPNLSDRTLFRFQVQGPSANTILEELNGGPLPDIGFFKMGKFNIGPHEVTALNHRMSGAPGYEFWGPSSVGDNVRQRILAIGQRYGLQQIGGRIYPVTSVESGWIGSALPAIYTGEATRAYREWLPAKSFEGVASIGGSYPSGDMDALYLTPFDMGYGFMAKYDHEFCGRSALERLAKQPKRKKVRLRWNAEDALDIQASSLRKGDRYKYMEMPVANYCTFLLDEVLNTGKRVGVAFYPVYSVGSREWISLASVDEGLAKDGQTLTITWGEPNGGSKKPSVERHIQKTVRVTVDSQPLKRD